ncbi:hypothetical protein PROFUN_02426 [Planoprotostelium fungivorum]|uniref:Uncharacterized protein n=1 Tax=Planoprotostelium fungivorum TaxID=1890364 RepID=A0A2P6NUW5_9EUKA|nr:hypothetical protein PROFUN_02426 [Planoprotostelium fungivorum]
MVQSCPDGGAVGYAISLKTSAILLLFGVLTLITLATRISSNVCYGWIISHLTLGGALNNPVRKQSEGGNSLWVLVRDHSRLVRVLQVDCDLRICRLRILLVKGSGYSQGTTLDSLEVLHTPWIILLRIEFTPFHQDLPTPPPVVIDSEQEYKVEAILDGLFEAPLQVERRGLVHTLSKLPIFVNPLPCYQETPLCLANVSMSRQRLCQNSLQDEAVSAGPYPYSSFWFYSTGACVTGHSSQSAAFSQMMGRDIKLKDPPSDPLRCIIPAETLLDGKYFCLGKKNSSVLFYITISRHRAKSLSMSLSPLSCNEDTNVPTLALDIC